MIASAVGHQNVGCFERQRGLQEIALRHGPYLARFAFGETDIGAVWRPVPISATTANASSISVLMKQFDRNWSSSVVRASIVTTAPRTCCIFCGVVLRDTLSGTGRDI